MDRLARSVAVHAAILHSRNDFNAAKAAGADILLAKMRAKQATARDFKYASDVVVIGTLVGGSRYEGIGDGQTSTLIFRVDEQFRGPGILKTVQVREKSGVLPNGDKITASTELFPELYDDSTGTFRTGSHWLLFLSKGMYQAQAVSAGMPPEDAILASSTYYGYLIVPSRIYGDKVEHLRQIELQNVPKSLGALRQQLLEAKE